MKMIFDRRQIILKKVLLVLCDIVSILAANILAILMRFEFVYSAIPEQFLNNSPSQLVIMICSTLIVFWLLRLYSSLWSYAGATEMMSIFAACVISSALRLITFTYQGIAMPRSYYPFFGGILFCLVVATRFSYRIMRRTFRMGADISGAKRVMVIGAGSAGNLTIREMNNSEHLKMKPVCVIDDDINKKNGYIHGVKIVGDRNDIVKMVEKYKVDMIAIAIPTASPKEMKEILEICKGTGCELKKLPGMYQLVNGDVSISSFKEVDVNDLLGREQVNVDISSIMEYVSNKVVLVTGGGGSIGSELCRQIAGHKPKMLIILDIYENSAYDIQNELIKKYPELNLKVLIGSVRNTNRIEYIFKTYRPEIIYHAAAHKHVPLMEENPNEAVKNNVLGTLKVVQAADKWKVKKFVMISTDKAVNPTNVMGATKRICEMIIQTYNRRSETEFVAVRFGNVLGSNGSVIPLFKKQIEMGGPVTVTHPDIIRYFMTIPEAVSLVLQAGAYAKGGEIFILDMGEPVKIVNLARNLILLSGHKPDEDIKIEFTGLRPGEKLYEEMLMSEEGMQDTENKLIHIGKPIMLDEDKFLKQLDELRDFVTEEPSPEEIRERIREIVPTYNPKP